MIHRFCSLKIVTAERIRLSSEDLKNLSVLQLDSKYRLLNILFSVFYFILYIFYNSLYKIWKRFNEFSSWLYSKKFVSNDHSWTWNLENPIFMSRDTSDNSIWIFDLIWILSSWTSLHDSYYMFIISITKIAKKRHRLKYSGC